MYENSFHLDVKADWLVFGGVWRCYLTMQSYAILMKALLCITDGIYSKHKNLVTICHNAVLAINDIGVIQYKLQSSFQDESANQ